MSSKKRSGGEIITGSIRQNSQNTLHPVENLIDCADTVDIPDDSALPVIGKARFALSLVGVDAVLNNRRIAVVLATFDLRSPREPAPDFIVGNGDIDDAIYSERQVMHN